MKNLTRVRVTATVETVIKKLSKAQIRVFNVEKKGAYTHFFVGHNYVEKVFAIFSHPCYNIAITKISPVQSLVQRLCWRIGAAVGCGLFFATVIFSQFCVFKIQVVGSGDYLAPQVEAILASCGVRAGSVFPEKDFSEAEAKVMALPSVTFCSFSKRGFVVVADVECNEEDDRTANYSPLRSDVGGEVVKIISVCGTPLVSVGDKVGRGDELIGAYYVAEDGQENSCLCVGYAVISVSASVLSRAESESDEALENAFAATRLYGEDSEVLSYTVKTTSEGVIYTVDFTYLHTVSVNMQ